MNTIYKPIVITIALVALSASHLYSQNLEIKFQERAHINDDEKGYLIAALTGVATDNDKNIYLFDFGQNVVHKLDPRGNFIDTIIRSGRGPGEIYSLYSYALDKEKEEIFIADGRNLRLLVTDLSGKELRSKIVDRSSTNVPMDANVLDDSTYAFTYSIGAYQSLRSEEGVDSLLHFHDSETLERTYSILDRISFHKDAGLGTPEERVINTHQVGEILFVDDSTLLLSPHIYAKRIMMYKRKDAGWKLHRTIKNEDLYTGFQPFTSIDFEDYRANRLKYIEEMGMNVVSTSSPDGNAAGMINLRSAGMFQSGDNRILNFIVVEERSENTFRGKLYAEVYDRNLNRIASQPIFESEPGQILYKVSERDVEGNYYLIILRPRNNSMVLKFDLELVEPGSVLSE